MTVGDRIKIRRKELGLSADELAKKLGKNRATIYRYESNDIENLPVGILEPLAKALQTTPSHLMGWDDEVQKQIEWLQSSEGDAVFEKSANLSDRLYKAIPLFLSQLKPDDGFITMTSTFAPEYNDRLMILTKATNPYTQLFMSLADDCITRLSDESSGLCTFTMLTCLYAHSNGYGVKNMFNFPLGEKTNDQGTPYSIIVEEFLQTVMKIAEENPDDLQKLLPIIKQFAPK